MLAVLLRIFYIILPVGLCIWFTIGNDSFHQAISYANSMQGRSGRLVINKDGQKSIGSKVQNFFENNLPTKNQNWLNVYRSAGCNLDRGISTLENYWFWGSVSIILLAGIFYLLSRKSYK